MEIAAAQCGSMPIYNLTFTLGVVVICRERQCTRVSQKGETQSLERQQTRPAAQHVISPLAWTLLTASGSGPPSPLGSQLTIPAELNRAVMELAPEARGEPNRSTRARFRTINAEGDRRPSRVGAATETNPARAARRSAIAPSPYPSGLLRFAISS